MRARSSALRAAAALALAALLAPCALAQGAPGRTSIAGRVLSDDGKPLPNATVFAFQAGGSFFGIQRVATDADGRFELPGLDPKPYRLFAYAPAYVMTDESQSRAYHRPGESVTISLARGGAITGTVTDASGRPAVYLPVRAVRKGRNAAPAGLSLDPPAETNTDDRGVYRIYGLAPGEYLVRAGGKSQNYPFLEGYPEEEEVPTYHPSSTRDTAVPVAVLGGGEATGVDIRYRGLKGHAVSGSIAGGFAADDFAAIVTLTSSATGATEEATFVTPGGPTLGFAFYGLADGEYVLVAESEGGPKSRGAASQPAKVVVRGADVTGVGLTLQPLASASGTVVVEPVPDREPVKGCARGVEPGEVAVQAKPAAPRPASFSDLLDIGRQDGVPDAAGAFTMRRLLPGRYAVAADPPDEGWYVKSMTLPRPAPKGAKSAGAAATVDLAREGLTLAAGQELKGLAITLAPGAARAEGRVVGADGRAPSGEVEVYLVPAEPEAADAVLRYARAAAGPGGAFTFRNLAPGAYRLVARAAPAAKAGAPPRPAFMDDAGRKALRADALAGGQPLALAECQRAAQLVVTMK